MGKHVCIIGSGIIGLTAAYYLKRAGHQVTVLDQQSAADGCSTGNAGMIVPSHIIPLAAPGMVAQGVRWMFDSKSPFYVRPRMNMELLQWGYQFYRHATRQHVSQSIPALKAISLYSKAAYQELQQAPPFDFGYHERGLLMLYQTAATEHEETETAAVANQHGVAAEILSATAVQAMEPNHQVKVRGGVYFPGDAHLNPAMLWQGLYEWLTKQQVNIRQDAAVRSFETDNKGVKAIITDQDDIRPDEVVIAAGAWTGAIVRGLGVPLPMQAGKGYSFMMSMQPNLNVPSLLLESRVAVTPMGESLRMGGTMEIAGVNHTINMKRVQGIVEAVPRYYPDIRPALPDVKTVWHGLRPCSPDGLPYVGRLNRCHNVTVAAGHGMMGLSLAPGTGKLVTSIIQEETPAIDLQPFNPNRYA